MLKPSNTLGNLTKKCGILRISFYLTASRCCNHLKTTVLINITQKLEMLSTQKTITGYFYVKENTEAGIFFSHKKQHRHTG